MVTAGEDEEPVPNIGRLAGRLGGACAFRAVRTLDLMAAVVEISGVVRVVPVVRNDGSWRNR
jgi:hypothetical protein